MKQVFKVTFFTHVGTIDGIDYYLTNKLARKSADYWETGISRRIGIVELTSISDYQYEQLFGDKRP